MKRSTSREKNLFPSWKILRFRRLSVREDEFTMSLEGFQTFMKIERAVIVERMKFGLNDRKIF